MSRQQKGVYMYIFTSTDYCLEHVTLKLLKCRYEHGALYTSKSYSATIMRVRIKNQVLNFSMNLRRLYNNCCNRYTG